MIGLGTLGNIALILIGSTIGLVIKGGLKKRFQDTIMSALGLAVIFIGISGALEGLLVIEDGKISSSNIMLMIVSLAIGGFLGEAINIEDKLDQVGEWLKGKLKITKEKDKGFVQGFVNSSLLFCVGAMAIIGSLKDGLFADPTILLAKGFIDGVVAIFFASTLGIGVFFSVIPVGIYQGIITLAAGYIEPYLSERLITNLSFVGSILIFAIGINMIFGKKIKSGNLLPAVLIPIIYEIILNFYNHN
ncbi:DUF554 domain-containing protein [Herbinix luporum]|jgi:uncharacterized membrane protein YqgA involved in biofilm formation|uniref:Putative membrane protein n=1 Tax=Herbinix luporum TaxID=1679721 RepID=A0A0K8J462_9FIRM|nr:DUF554 domain-containing protein [Herbinix luporum]MDI9488806.1 DUF554 domain-containing protein [Bacillota bacterium]CUH92275.1 putative membrane protein [Herbinix luporum]HHT57689.1 DUF554 domain-containing protein [Herbinix luporum]